MPRVGADAAHVFGLVPEVFRKGDRETGGRGDRPGDSEDRRAANEKASTRMIPVSLRLAARCACVFSDAPLFGMVDHSYELPKYSVVSLIKFRCFLFRDVFTSESQIEPDACFFRFTFRVAQLALEMCWIAALAPSLTNIRADRTRRAAHLVNH